MEKLIASRKANAGANNLRQIILGTFDQRVHSQNSADTAKEFSDIYSEILGIRAIPGTNMTASWDHMCGYDAQYYGYLVSIFFLFWCKTRPLFLKVCVAALGNCNT